MTSVIVVEDDGGFLRAIDRELRREGMDVQCTDNVEQALAWLREGEADVLLTDLCIREESGIDLMKRARELSPRTRGILMSGYASAQDYETAMALGAVRVLIKPFSNEQLVEAIRRAAECDTGFRGSFHGLGLIDLLQVFHYGRRSITLVVSPGTKGKIFVDQGNVVHAEHGALKGEKALREMLSLPAGALRTEAFTPPEERSIQRGFQEVLLDSLRQIDEDALAAPAEIVSGMSIAPPARGSVAPSVPPARTSHLPLRPQLLSSRFSDALRALPQRSNTLLAVGMRLSTGEVETLHGTVDPTEVKDAIIEIVTAARAMSADSPSGYVERMAEGVYLQVTWDRSVDAAYLVADGFGAPGEGSLLRASTQMFARKFLGVE